MPSVGMSVVVAVARGRGFVGEGAVATLPTKRLESRERSARPGEEREEAEEAAAAEAEEDNKADALFSLARGR